MAVYRVAHQSLADHLRPPYRRTGERPFDPDAGPGMGRRWPSGTRRCCARASRPTRRAICGATPTGTLPAAGLPGLDRLRGLVPARALNCGPTSPTRRWRSRMSARSWGRRAEALPPPRKPSTILPRAGRRQPRLPARPRRRPEQPRRPLQRAGPARRGARPHPRKPSTLYRALAADNPAFLPDLAMAPEQPRHPLQRAGPARRGAAPHRGSRRRSTARWPPTTPPSCPTSPCALNNLGIRYSELGRRAEALPPPEEAVDALPRAGRRQPRLPARPRHGPEQPRHPLQRAGPARRGAAPHPRKPSTSTARWPPTTPPSCPTSPWP